MDEGEWGVVNTETPDFGPTVITVLNDDRDYVDEWRFIFTAA